MVLEKLQKLDGQFKRVEDTIQQAIDAKAKINSQIKTLEEQLLVLKGQYQAYVDIGQELREFTVDENGVITPIERIEQPDVCNYNHPHEGQQELNSPMMDVFKKN